VKNVAHNNGRVGWTGTSYDGFLVTMAMINPHPALKAVSPSRLAWETPGWATIVFHNGAFRLSYAFEYAPLMETSAENYTFPFDSADLYDFFLRLGPLANANAKYFHGQTSELERICEPSEL